MDLILWRHAEANEAVEGGTDLDRDLTSRGPVEESATA